MMRIMNKLKYLPLLFFPYLFLSGCHQEKIEARSYPRLRTLNVTDVSPEGATFRGEVITMGNSPVLEYGFVWSLGNSPDLKSSEHVTVKETFSSGKFSCRIDYSLIWDHKYYVRSYVRTQDLVVYGDVVSFVSDGTKLPVIHEVLPSSGFWGDTISFIGERFSSIKNLVHFGNIEGQVVYNSDSLFKAVVPSEPNEELVDIEFQGGTGSVVFPDFFRFRIPEIKDFSPHEAMFGDTVIINGHNFDPKKNFTKVFFNDIESEIVYLNDSILKTIVPETLKSSVNQLNILSDSFRVSSKEKFSLAPIEISGFSTDTFTVFESDLLLTIYGSGFSDLVDNNTVLFDDFELEVRGAWKDSLHVIIPLSIFPDFDYFFDLEGVITVKVADQSILAEDSIHFINEGIYSWKEKAHFPGQGRVDALTFSLNGKGYIGTGLNYEDSANEQYFSDFWEYDPVSNNWSRIDDLPGPGRAGAVAMKINEEVYVGLGSSNYDDEEGYLTDWYLFNADGSWTQLKDFPGAGRYGSFSIMNFLGGGNIASNDLGQRSYRDLWTYEPTMDSWTPQTEIPYSIVEDDGLLLDNTGYIFSENKIFEFKNGKWDYYYVPGVSQGYSCFSLRDVLFRAFPLGEGNDLSGSKVILAANMVLLEASEIDFPGSKRTNVNVFTINDSAYFVGGTTYDNGAVFLTDVYELSINE